jgi:hypothetical protein
MGDERPHGRRIARERKTIRVMIGMYCRDHHGKDAAGMCRGCRELHDFAMFRIDKCPFRSGKPTCVNCPIHCYQPAMRQRVREIMRYSGPRMLRRHPILAILHLLDGRRQVQRPVGRRPAPRDGVERTGRRSRFPLPLADERPFAGDPASASAECTRT